MQLRLIQAEDDNNKQLYFLCCLNHKKRMIISNAVFSEMNLLHFASQSDYKAVQL
jgi:hypothetical protein